jgi:hypothetical protein
VTDRQRARRTLILAAAILLGSLFVVHPWPADAQSKKTTTTTTVPETTVPIAPGETAPNGGPLLVPGEVDTASSSAADTSNSDNTGTVVALVISGLLVGCSPIGSGGTRGRGSQRGPRRTGQRGRRRPKGRLCRMADELDVEAMKQRFRDRAAAVRNRPLPPIAGEERTAFIRQAQLDFQDYAIIGDAAVTIEDGVLVLRIDLRPSS